MVVVEEVEAVGVVGRLCHWQWVAVVEVEAQHSKKRWEVEAAQPVAALVAKSMMRLEVEAAQGAVAPWEVGSRVVALKEAALVVGPAELAVGSPLLQRLAEAAAAVRL